MSIFAGVKRTTMNSYSFDTLQRTRKAMIHLTEDLSQRMTIEQLSRIALVNSHTLQGCFKYLYGKTIFEYVQELRIARAKELLRSTNLNLQQIAMLCGYREQSNFSFAFKKTEGLGPGLWRKGK